MGFARVRVGPMGLRCRTADSKVEFGGNCFESTGGVDQRDVGRGGADRRDAALCAGNDGRWWARREAGNRGNPRRESKETSRHPFGEVTNICSAMNITRFTPPSERQVRPSCRPALGKEPDWRGNDCISYEVRVSRVDYSYRPSREFDTMMRAAACSHRNTTSCWASPAAAAASIPASNCLSSVPNGSPDSLCNIYPANVSVPFCPVVERRQPECDRPIGRL